MIGGADDAASAAVVRIGGGGSFATVGVLATVAVGVASAARATADTGRTRYARLVRARAIARHGAATSGSNDECSGCVSIGGAAIDVGWVDAGAIAVGCAVDVGDLAAHRVGRPRNGAAKSVSVRLARRIAVGHDLSMEPCRQRDWARERLVTAATHERAGRSGRKR